MYNIVIVCYNMSEKRDEMIKDALFYKDNYLKEFNTKVLECIEEKGKIKIVLENTAFYPEGGGQPADIGYIDKVKVIHVEEKEGKIYHEVEKKIEVGKDVSCKINFEERFSNMQNHTAEHIVSGLICQKYNATNVGFHIGKDFTTMDFDVTISEKDLREIEKQANEAVYQNIQVKEKLYSPEEVKCISYRSKKELKEDVRLVKIGEYDICACCGIHVSKTGEIGIIKLLKAEKYKTGTRIYMLAGFKAVEDYTNKFYQINNISTLLSLKLDEVYDGVVNLVKEIDNLKKEKSILKEKILNQELNEIKPEKDIIIEMNDLDIDDMKASCNKIKEKATRIAGVFSNNKFIFMSNTENLKELLESLKSRFDIKGGGSNNMIQGQTSSNIQEIITEIKGR